MSNRLFARATSRTRAVWLRVLALVPLAALVASALVPSAASARPTGSPPWAGDGLIEATAACKGGHNVVQKDNTTTSDRHDGEIYYVTWRHAKFNTRDMAGPFYCYDDVLAANWVRSDPSDNPALEARPSPPSAMDDRNAMQAACNTYYGPNAPNAEVVKRDSYDSSSNSPFYSPGRPVYATQVLFATTSGPYVCRGTLPANAVDIVQLRDARRAAMGGYTAFGAAGDAQNAAAYDSSTAAGYCSRYYPGRSFNQAVVGVVSPGVYVANNGPSGEYFKHGVTVYTCAAEVENWTNVDNRRNADGSTGIVYKPVVAQSSYQIVKGNCPNGMVVLVLANETRNSQQLYNGNYRVFVREPGSESPSMWREDTSLGNFECVSRDLARTRTPGGPAPTFQIGAIAYADFSELQAARDEVIIAAQKAEAARQAELARQAEIARPTQISLFGTSSAQMDTYCTTRYGAGRNAVVRQAAAISQQMMAQLHHAQYVTSAVPQFSDPSFDGRYLCKAEADAMGHSSADGFYRQSGATAPLRPGQSTLTSNAASAYFAHMHSCSSDLVATGALTHLNDLVFATRNETYYCDPAKIHYNYDAKGYVTGIKMGDLPEFKLTPAAGTHLVASGAGNLVASGAGNLVASGAGNVAFTTNDGAPIIAAGRSGVVTQDASGLVAFGAGNLVASGAGNVMVATADLVASGAGNLVASGAGNFGFALGTLVASGGGNLVASGAGNLVASGAGNLISNVGGTFSGTGSGTGSNAGVVSTNGTGLMGDSMGTLRAPLIAALSQSSGISGGQPFGGGAPLSANGGGFKQDSRLQAFSNGATPMRTYPFSKAADALVDCGDPRPNETTLRTRAVLPYDFYLTLPSDPTKIAAKLAGFPVSALACARDMENFRLKEYTGSTWVPPAAAATTGGAPQLPGSGAPAAPFVSRPPAAKGPAITSVHAIAPSGFYLVDSNGEAWVFGRGNVTPRGTTGFDVGNVSFAADAAGSGVRLSHAGVAIVAAGAGSISGSAGSYTVNGANLLAADGTIPQQVITSFIGSLAKQPAPMPPPNLAGTWNWSCCGAITGTWTIRDLGNGKFAGDFVTGSIGTFVGEATSGGPVTFARTFKPNGRQTWTATLSADGRHMTGGQWTDGSNRGVFSADKTSP